LAIVHVEYGFPLRADADLFERLVLEMNQAGLSWLTFLKKRDAFRLAYNAEITHDFLLSTGYLPGAHAEDCPVRAHILRLSPPWSRA
jgi:3-methyladenine DNA glycosylase Tag